jgi:hypothetical protein
VFCAYTEILAGSVSFINNAMLCFEKTIAWDDIVTGEGAQVTHAWVNNVTRPTCKFTFLNLLGASLAFIDRQKLPERER